MVNFNDWFNIVNKLADENTEENLSLLKEYLLERDSHSYDKHIIPKYVSRLFIYFGTEGIIELGNILILEQTEGYIYPTSILHTIFAISQKRHILIPFLERQESELKYPEITEEIAQTAQMVFNDIVSRSHTDFNLFELVADFMFNNAFRNVEIMMTHDAKMEEENARAIYKIFTESTIKINKKMISDFNKLINQNNREEVYQEFLTKNPVLIDPLAKLIIPKQKLGVEYITDFVLRKFTDEYVLIEIEKPSDRIFNASNDFTSRFTHALGQILDFQEWVEANIAYAQKHMPNIISPTGLLIIGLSSELTTLQKSKLRRFNVNNNGKVRVICFDEIVENANKLYNNIVS